MKYLGETSLKKLISLIKADLALKVDKVNGKGLSTNDYTNSEKDKLAGIATGANKTTVDSSLSSTSTNPVQNKVINGALSKKANSSHTHNASDITGTLELDHGGTGATSASDARAKLGAAASSHTLDYLPLSGGTLTGDLTGKYFKGTWLQTTSATDLGKTPPNIAVLDKEGWIYKRTPAEILSDTVGKTTLTFSQTSDAYLRSFSYTAFALTGLRIGFIRIYGQTNKSLTANSNYVLTGVPNGYGANSMCALAVHSSKNITAWMGGDGVHIRAREAVGVGYDVVICGIWFY